MEFNGTDNLSTHQFTFTALCYVLFKLILTQDFQLVD